MVQEKFSDRIMAELPKSGKRHKFKGFRYLKDSEWDEFKETHI
jgi:hypothetical protein